MSSRKTRGPEQPEISGEDIWTKLSKFIERKRFIPIISNSVRCEAIFGRETFLAAPEPNSDDAGGEKSVREYTIDEQLVMKWADSLTYPMAEKHKLVRVAQFNSLNKIASDANEEYLNFFKRHLLKLAKIDKDKSEVADDLEDESELYPFTEIAHDILEYPVYAEEEDPLRLLAKLNLPIYVTTSYYDFLQRILLKDHDVVHTHICPWSESVGEEYLPRLDFKPSVEEPVVYHLFGHENNPDSMVLSEDDHFDFLFEILNKTPKTRGTDVDNDVIPSYLRNALNRSALMLLGYRLQDWDFRILFRALIKAEAKRRVPGVVIQLEPDNQIGAPKPSEARRYLERTLKPSSFTIEWQSTEQAVNKLWEAWQKRQEL